MFLRGSGDSPAAVEAGQRAIAATAADDPERERRLSNLANALRDASDVDSAIATLRLAADQGHPVIASNLALALERAGHTEEAITVLRRALDNVPANHPGRPGMLANLATVYRQRLSLSGSSEDRATAMRLIGEAAGLDAAGPARYTQSYAPTIRALAHAQSISESADDRKPRSLIVAMRTSPGNSPELQLAAREAARVRPLLPDPAVLMEPANATVVRYLDKCTVAHFACHGLTDAADPSRSGLVLADRPLTVAALASLHLNVARLAYLSACNTAVSDADGLSDEAIHIASACQLAGFPHVVGTLWPIDDPMASVVAASFYEGLRGSSGRTNPARAAEALHRTTRQLRAKYPGMPTRWASHIHVGA